MRLTNTSGFPNAFVREVYRFVKPAGAKVREVCIRGTKGYGGSGHATSHGRVVVTAGAPSVVSIPASWRIIREQGLKARDGWGGYLSFAHLSNEEMLVSVLAHECRHIQQGQAARRASSVPVSLGPQRLRFGGTGRRTSKPRLRGMVWGSRGAYSERDADAYALRILRKWRRAHAGSPWWGSASFVHAPTVIDAVPGSASPGIGGDPGGPAVDKPLEGESVEGVGGSLFAFHRTGQNQAVTGGR